MYLEQAIHQRWAASDDLIALLPAEKLTTGRAMDAAIPYATVERGKRRTVARTNATDWLDEIGLKIHVWHSNYDAGWAIVEQINSAFDRSPIDLAEENRLVHIRHENDTAKQHADGTWHFEIQFIAQVLLSSGI